MAKIVLIGAGITFLPPLDNGYPDLPELRENTINLMDIDKNRWILLPRLRKRLSGNMGSGRR